MFGELLKELLALTARIKARSSVNVNDEATKDGAIALATKYFNSFRPVLLETLGDSYDTTDLDAGWQELVRLAHGNNGRRTYVRMLRRLASEVKEANVGALSRASERRGSMSSPSHLTAAETQLLGTLEALLPTAAASYRQGLLDLSSEQRLSFRGTASEFREALRETLDHLAPDGDVTKHTGFKCEDGQTRPTMKQKTRFVLTSRGRSKTQAAVTEKAIAVIEGLTGELVRATYDRASLATHLETTRAEVQRIKRYVDTVFFDLLEIPEAARVTPPRR